MTRSVLRKRHTLKWIGLVLSVMMLGLWVFSVLFVTHGSSIGPWSLSIAFGRIGFAESPLGPPGSECTPYYSPLKLFAAQKPWIEFAYTFLGFRLPFKGIGGMLFVPVWLFVVAVGFPTGILWWRDRRPKAGLCKVCKYDLTGNESGVCPECGTAVSPETG